MVRAAAEDSRADSPAADANPGLGLHVVRDIAKAHGGSVELSSAASHPRLRLRLPRITPR